MGLEGIRREDVIRALDSRIHRDHVSQADMIAWLGRAIDSVEQRGMTVTYMARHLNHLADVVASRLGTLAICPNATIACSLQRESDHLNV